MKLKKIIAGSMFAVMMLHAQSAKEIAKKSFEKMSGYQSSISETKMVLKNAQGATNTRKMLIKKLESSNGDKSLIVFLYPMDIKDTKLLSYEQIGKDDKQWLYLPALKRVKRISSRNKSGSFMASEFSYEDIASQNYRNYSYKSKAEKVTKNGKTYLKIERIPKDKHSGYSKQVVYIEPKTYLAKFGEYYDRNGRLLKKVSFLKYRKINGIDRIVKMEMKNVQNGKSTLLVWEHDHIKAGLNSADFSKRALK
ncbi:Outer membrane lipoprotein-sorting protein [hydrothermal vent metagenome]|uniref:Outer membrane lipoprotein-sorting protein n=1 Tax=hydrothermal vent metagenome TaxID=652676 RepID=A0A1W1E7T6_9ZZZZ